MAQKTNTYMVGRQEAETEVILDRLIDREGSKDKALLFVVSQIPTEVKVSTSRSCPGHAVRRVTEQYIFRNVFSVSTAVSGAMVVIFLFISVFSYILLPSSPHTYRHLHFLVSLVSFETI